MALNAVTLMKRLLETEDVDAPDMQHWGQRLSIEDQVEALFGNWMPHMKDDVKGQRSRQWGNWLDFGAFRVWATFTLFIEKESAILGYEVKQGDLEHRNHELIHGNANILKMVEIFKQSVEQLQANPPTKVTDVIRAMEQPLSYAYGVERYNIQNNHLPQQESEADEREVKRYLQYVKPNMRRFSRDFLRYVMSTPEGRKKLLHLRDEPEPPSEPHQIVPESIEHDLLSASKKIKHCGDYGCLYYHPGKHEVHWTGGDADGPPEFTHPDEIVKLLSLPGIKHVEIGDEWSPDEDEGWVRLNEAEELPPEEPTDIRSEVDRLLPTRTYRLGGSSMIHAPGVIRMAQNEWRNGRKKQKAWAMGVVRAWEGLPEDVYLQILNGTAHIEADGDNAVVTVKN